MRIFIHLPLVDISLKEPGQWCIYESTILENEWKNLIDKHRKFIEEYFPANADNICEFPLWILGDCQEIESIRHQEARQVFGTTWNRSYIVAANEVPENNIVIPSYPADPILLADIRRVFITTLSRRLFQVFREIFPQLLEPRLPQMPMTGRRTFLNKPPEEPDKPKVHYMRFTKGYVTKFDEEKVNELAAYIDLVGRDFAAKNCGLDISLNEKLTQIQNSGGYQIAIPMEGIRTDSTLPALIPIVSCYDSENFPTQTRYVVDIYREDKLWKLKKGRMIPYSFMEMWYKLFDQMEGEKCYNWSIVLAYATTLD